VHGRPLAGRLDRVVSREFGKRPGGLLVDRRGDTTILARRQIKDLLVSAALGRSEGVTMTLIDRVLKHTSIPAIDEVSMVSIPSRITVREDERLVRVHRLGS